MKSFLICVAKTIGVLAVVLIVFVLPVWLIMLLDSPCIRATLITTYNILVVSFIMWIVERSHAR